MDNPSAKRSVIDRLIGNVSPKWAAEREYYRSVREQIPRFDAVYAGQLPTRLDTQWNTTVGYMGANNPLNRWRLTKMRDRSRDLERNNAVACAMLDRCVENVIGHGFTLRPLTSDTGFNKDAKELWDDWLGGADLRGMASAAELQRLVFRCMLRDGDAGVAFVRKGSDAYLQTFTGDLIDTAYGGYNFAENILDGIKFDQNGRPLEYHVLGIAMDGQRSETIISARDFVFMARRRSPNQTRGEPAFAQNFALFDQISGYVEAAVVAARIAACQALLIKSNNAGKEFGTLVQSQNSNNQGQAFETMEPGMVRRLRPGEDVVTVNPAQPTQSFPDFITQLLRFAGITMGLPLELVMLDFSRTNYSSARASLLQAYRSFRTLQQQFADQFLARTYRWRLSKWVKDGTLAVPAAIEDSFWDHTWQSPGWAWVDPQREIAGAMAEIDAGFNSRTAAMAERGRDFEDVAKRLAEELETLEKLGLSVSRSTLTRDPLPAGVAAPPIAGKPSVKAGPTEPDAEVEDTDTTDPTEDADEPIGD